MVDIGKINFEQLNQLLGVKNATKAEIPSNLKMIQMNKVGGQATKQVTNKDIENFVNEPRPSKAATALLEKSPVGLGNEPSKKDIEKMGYEFAGTQYHPGAPVIYKSSDGGTITIYNGKGTAEMGEDKRKIVYQKGNLIQEMYYDDNGNLKEGKIIVKDNLAGFEERKISFLTENGKTSFIE